MSFRCWIEVLNEWQTLVAGGLALVGALITVFIINRQIKTQERHFQNTTQRKEWAARSRIPDSLSEMCRYCDATVECIFDPSRLMPNLPINAISELKEVIEFVEPNASKRLFELLSHYQVQRARLESFVDERNPSSPIGIEAMDQLYDLAVLRALVDSLYEYGRNQDEVGPTKDVSREEVNSGLRVSIGLAIFVRDEERFAEVKEMIDRRHQ